MLKYICVIFVCAKEERERKTERGWQAVGRVKCRFEILRDQRLKVLKTEGVRKDSFRVSKRKNFVGSDSLCL